MAAAAPALGREVSLDVSQSIEADSNVFRRPEQQVADGIYKLGLAGELREEGKRLSYDLRYLPTFRTYFQTSGLNGWDHFLSTTGSYQFSPQDAVEAKFGYQNYQAIRGDTVLDATGDPQVVERNDGRVERIDAGLTYRRSFGQRVGADVTLDFQQITYTALRNVDNMGLGGTAQVQYSILKRLSLGASFVGRYRVFEEQLSLPSSTATTLNPNLTAAVDISPTVQLRLSGGPSVIISQQDTPTELIVSRWVPASLSGGAFGRYDDPSIPSSCTTSLSISFTALAACPLVPASVLQGRLDETSTVGFLPGESIGGESSRDSTYFLDVSLTKRFARSSVGFSYRRSDDAGSGQGTVNVLDSVNVNARWSASDFWEVVVTGLWLRRQSSSDLEQAVSSAVDNTDGLRSDPFTDSNGVFYPTGVLLAEAGQLWVTSARNEVDLTQWQAVMRVTRKFTKRIKMSGEFRYYRQDQAVILGSGSADFDNYTALVALTYSFDPFRF